MKKTNYTPQTFLALEAMRKQKAELNFMSDNDQTLVLDIYDCGEASFDAWAAKLKATARDGSLFAYDHRLDGTVDSNLPSVSIMFEAIHGTAGLAEASSLAGSSSYFSKLASMLTNKVLAETIADNGLELSRSNRLLSLATAF